MKYLLVDTTNTFFRARHIANSRATLEEKTGMAIHITMSSIAKVWREQNPDHVVFALEGRSWRKDEYKPYKKNREAAKALLTPKGIEEDEAFWNAYADMVEFLNAKTNASVLISPNAEADDIIARFIALHPDDEHIILSSDSDLLQLIAENVTVFNGMTGHTWSLQGVVDLNGKPVIDKKTKLPKDPPNPQWLLFEKCIRGDSSDNVFSAYPRVNKNKLKAAFDDRDKKGYAWNNVMLQRWVDHNKKEHKVIEDYERNKKVIDLTAQPDNIKMEIDSDIKVELLKDQKKQVGTNFIIFCGKHQLVKLVDYANTFGDILSKGYKQ